MKKFILIAGIALLAACSEKQEAAAPEAAASLLVFGQAQAGRRPLRQGGTMNGNGA